MEQCKSATKPAAASAQDATCEAEALLAKADYAAVEVPQEQASASFSTDGLLANILSKSEEHIVTKCAKTTAPKREGDIQSTSSDDDDAAAGRKTEQNGGPDWDLDPTMELLQTGGKEIRDKIQYMKSIQASLVPRKAQDPGKAITFHLSVGDRVWILPDKQSGTVPKEFTNPEELPDQYWNVGEIVNCCQIEDAAGSPIQFLEVVWLYAYEEVWLLAPKYMHRDWVERVDKYGLQENERVLTDHRDFVPLSSLAGLATGVYTHLQIQGLAVSAADNASPAKGRRVVRMSGFNNRKQGIEISAKGLAERKAIVDQKKLERSELKRKAKAAREAEASSQDQIDDQVQEGEDGERTRASSRKRAKTSRR